jgi:dipeptidyl aminopeptidase/acylaminoacyl peptidase
VEDFDVSRDGRWVACFVNQEGVSVLRVFEAKTGRERRLPALPSGVGTGLRWHPNGRELGFTLSSARSPSDVYSVDVRKATLTRWTASETGGLPAGRFSEPETIRVRSFDGLALSGFLYRPDPRRFPGPRPVLLVIHGGPESQSRPVFQGRWNYLTDHLGVAVFHPNVRGSAGYGKTFLTLDNGLRREDSVKDIGAFLDWMDTQPGLDGKRVGVYGASYGGFMVLSSLAMHGERLRCGIDVVGISNFQTFLQNTQDYRRDLRRAEYGDERDPGVAEFLRRISPLTRVDRIRKPLLVVQGLNDPRVPVTEAEQMVKALRAQGGIAAYLLAKDEGHGFQKKKNSDFMFLAAVEFLKRHLLE